MCISSENDVIASAECYLSVGGHNDDVSRPHDIGRGATANRNIGVAHLECIVGPPDENKSASRTTCDGVSIPQNLDAIERRVPEIQDIVVTDREGHPSVLMDLGVA